MGERPQTSPVVVVQELGLVGGHVHARRALRDAAATGEAEVERLAHLPGPPALLGQAAGHHLLEEPGAATGGVLLLARGPEARAHELGALRGDAAPDPDAALHGEAEVTPVAAEGLGRPDVETPGRQRSEVGTHRRRGHDDARIEDAGRVPDGLELGERAAQLGAELALQQGAARPSIAMLARERAAVGDDEVRRRVDEALETLRATRPVEAEAHPQVHAALAVVAVRDGLEALLAEERPKPCQVAGQPLGRHGRVLEARPGGGAIRQPRGMTRAVLADAPEDGLLGLAGQQADVGGAEVTPDGCRQLVVRARAQPPESRPSLDEQPGPARGQSDVVGRHVGQLEQLRRERLDGERAGGQQSRDRLGALDVVGEAEHQEATRRGWSDEAHGGARDDRAAALGAHQGPGDVSRRAPAAASRGRSRRRAAATAGARGG